MFVGAALLLGAIGANGQIPAQIGTGSQSCGMWVEVRHNKSVENSLKRAMLLSWVQGYLVGIAITAAEERSTDPMADQIASGKIPPDVSDKAIVTFRQRMFGTVTGWIFDPPDSDAIQVWMDK